MFRVFSEGAQPEAAGITTAICKVLVSGLSALAELFHSRLAILDVGRIARTLHVSRQIQPCNIGGMLMHSCLCWTCSA